MDGLRIEQVVLAVVAPLVLAADLKHVPVDWPGRKRAPVPEQNFLSDDLQPDAFDARRRPGEILVNNRLLQADSFENLRAPVALDGRDAHLGDDLDTPLHGRFKVTLAGGLMIDAGQQALAN